MMKIERIDLTNVNVAEVLRDQNVYVILTDAWRESKYAMLPIGKCEVKTVLSDNVAIIRVTEEES